MRDVFIERLTALAASNPRIFLITGDLGFGVLTDFAKKFPSQFLNVGIAEQNMIGVATGLALEGRTVFVYSIGNFPTLRCLEQIRNDACYHNANVKIVLIGGGFSYGGLGMSHHATEDLAIMRVLPNMTVVVPGDAWEAAEATSAIAMHPGVCYLRLDKSKAPITHRPEEAFELGKIRVVRDGSDVTLVCCGGILATVLKAAETLAEHGVSCRVLSMHTLKPFDHVSLVRLTRDTPVVVTVEEHAINGGLGGAVAESLMEAGIHPKRFLRIGLNDTYSAIVGSQEYLRKQYGMDEGAIVARTLAIAGVSAVEEIREAYF